MYDKNVHSFIMKHPQDLTTTDEQQLMEINKVEQMEQELNEQGEYNMSIWNTRKTEDYHKTDRQIGQIGGKKLLLTIELLFNLLFIITIFFITATQKIWWLSYLKYLQSTKSYVEKIDLVIRKALNLLYCKILKFC